MNLQPAKNLRLRVRETRAKQEKDEGDGENGLSSQSGTLCAAEIESQSANPFEMILFQISHIIKTYKPQDLMRHAQQRKEQSFSEMSQSRVIMS